MGWNSRTAAAKSRKTTKLQLALRECKAALLVAELRAGGAAKLVPLGSVRGFGDELARGQGRHP